MPPGGLPKFVPVIVTWVPGSPFVGVKLVMVGSCTVKSVALVPVPSPTVTEIGPVVAPEGTVVSIVVVVDVITVAAVPLNFTVLSAGVRLKFVPVIVTEVPKGPIVGLKPVTVGAGNPTVKSVALVLVNPPTVMEIGPVVVPVATVAVMLVGVAAVTVAKVPLNLTWS